MNLFQPTHSEHTGSATMPQPVAQRRGLDAATVERQRAKFGTNVLTPPTRKPWWELFLEKFEDPVIRILMIAAAIAIAAGSIHGEYLEGIGIIAAILLATGLAFVNEFKANREFDILNQVNDVVPIKVIRGGEFTHVPIRDIVVGDIVFVEAGEEVPADGRMLEAVNLQVVESSLTGEPDPNRKRVPGEATAPSTATIPADRLMRGTKIVDGHGIFEVTEVGDATEIGKTARAGAEETGEQTPLNEQLERLSKVIGVVGLGVAAATFAALTLRGAITGELTLTGPQWTAAAILAAGAAIALSLIWLPMVFDGLELLGVASAPVWLVGEDGNPDDDEAEKRRKWRAAFRRWLIAFGLGALVACGGVGLAWFAGVVPVVVTEWLPPEAAGEFLKSFMIAVTIIVVAVPEGLAMSVTLSLAYSMRKMTAANTLVRKMDACETIGATTVICSDKTGTLTMNEMRVFEAHFPALGRRLLTANETDPVVRLVVEGIAANTTAHLNREDPTRPTPLGNPTEGALLLWLHDCGIDYVVPRSQFAVDAQMTFSTERKYMATFGTSPQDGPLLHVKGAPEILLTRCTQVLTADGPTDVGSHRMTLEASLKDFQSRGMRTLGLAYRKHSDLSQGLDTKSGVEDLIWLGFIAISDPVRPEVPAAIAACRRAGIQVKMVTGDNPETAQEIARQIGLWDGTQATTRHVRGPDFGALDAAGAEVAAQQLAVLSRAKPTDKVRLVRALQARGEVVAVTGDGINDCGALNHANIGLAMGRTGKAAAKEASDIILLDDSFGTIVNAVLWGRSLYENIQRFILFQLTINVAALGVALLGPFIGVKLPLTVIQMLWVNLIMDTFAALALATEPPHPDVLQRPPRARDAFIVTRRMAIEIFGVGGAFLAILVGLLLYIQRDGVVTDHELSVFFAVFVMLQFWNLFNARCLGLRQSALLGLGGNKSLLAIAAAIFAGTVLLVQFGGSVFRTVPLSLTEWAVIVAATSAVLWLGELVRWIRRNRDATTDGTVLA